jgi:peptidoglycan/LPS O-acetylase OafA/YrhL
MRRAVKHTSAPAIDWLARSQNDVNAWHAILLSALRAFAALQVASGHLRSELFPGLRSLSHPPLAYQGLAFVTGFAHQAVVLLFLISGWLVGGKLLDKIAEPDAVKHYVIDRVTRLWTVLIPCFFLMLLIGIASGKLNPVSIDLGSADPYAGRAFAGNLLGLQHIAVPDFGGNYSLWTLAHQSWYYLLFPLLLVCAAPGNATRRTGAGLAALAFVVWLPGAIVLYGSVWLLGTLFSRIRIRCSPRLRLLSCAAAIGTGVYYRLFGLKDDIVAASLVQDLVFALTVLVFLACMRLDAGPARRPWRRIIDVLAAFSFTLYVLHVPLIGILRQLGIERLSPAAAIDYVVYAGALGAILATSYLWSLAFEARTTAIRRIATSWSRKRAMTPA